MVYLHVILAFISTVYCSSYSAQQEKKLCLTRCELEWAEDRQQPSTPMLQFFGRLNCKISNGFFLSLSSQEYPSKCNDYLISKQEFSLLLMQYIGLNIGRPLHVYGTLDDQPISIAMPYPICHMLSSLDKDYTRASIGLHLQQTSCYSEASSYEVTIKNDPELPLFAQNKIYEIIAREDVHRNLTTKQEDFWTHYLYFKFKISCDDFSIVCYVSTMRALNKKLIISDPYFCMAKEKILLLLQAIQHIESSVESNYNA